MLNYVLSRFLTFIPTFLGVTLISFGFIRLLPGDPILVMAGERGLTEERYAELTEQFGFDRPMIVQFWDYLLGVLQGDLGQSFVTKRPVWDEFFALFPATLELSVCAMIFAVALGLPAGVIAAVNRGKLFDRPLMSTALVGYSMPIFWWALLLIIVFFSVLLDKASKPVLTFLNEFLKTGRSIGLLCCRNLFRCFCNVTYCIQ